MMTAKNTTPLRRTAGGAVLGAIAGGGIASLVVILSMLSEPRFIADALVVLGTGGIIGGAVCGAAIGLIGRGGKRLTLGIGLAGGMCGCILAMIATVVYTAVPWPSPQPYPGAEPVVGTGAGSWGVTRGQVYTITVSMNELRGYYEEQMDRHCESKWRFEVPSYSDVYSTCLQATCEVHRPWMGQMFEVMLCPVSDSETVVHHLDMYQD
jgi:hypothetical protein